jgi:hypothetical protein
MDIAGSSLVECIDVCGRSAMLDPFGEAPIGVLASTHPQTDKKIKLLVEDRTSSSSDDWVRNRN